jgi:tetratricopeptide (TPR) repeat protein
VSTGEVDEYRQQVDRLRVVRRYDDAVRIGGEGLARFPDDYALHCQMALALVGRGDLDEALRVAVRATGLDAQPSFAFQVVAIVHQRHGPSHAAQAIEAAQRSVEHANGDWRSLVVLSLSYRLARRFGDSRSCAQQAVRAGPGLVEPVIELAWSEIGLRHWAEAEAVARHALAIDPSSATAHHALGIALQHRGDSAAAARSFMTAKRIDPTRSAAGGSLVHLASTRSASIMALCIVAAAIVVSHDSPLTIALLAGAAIALTVRLVRTWRIPKEARAAARAEMQSDPHRRADMTMYTVVVSVAIGLPFAGSVVAGLDPTVLTGVAGLAVLVLGVVLFVRLFRWWRPIWRTARPIRWMLLVLTCLLGALGLVLAGVATVRGFGS